MSDLREQVEGLRLMSQSGHVKVGDTTDFRLGWNAAIERVLSLEVIDAEPALTVESLAAALATQRWTWLDWTDDEPSGARRDEAFRNAAAAILAALDRGTE